MELLAAGHRDPAGGHRVAFHAYSETSGTTRHYRSFSQAVDELVSARVWGGVHFRTADLPGRDLGEAVSDYVTAVLQAGPRLTRGVRSEGMKCALRAAAWRDLAQPPAGVEYRQHVWL